MTTQPTSPSSDPPPSWQKVHDEAIMKGQDSYIDPATGYMVMTSLSHSKRGYCCGNNCRHCPFDHRNVGKLDQVKIDKAQARARQKAAKADNAGVGAASASGDDDLSW
ncbi:hypothetical protein BCR44DRAFT_37294 [Catenaria anguillulae PL171]|uniref:Uncharacterized protein n=1 Tax=Catenaria anguillulae PL171 TaxID=765915 RepID=A0A1Y2HHA5_9FUNG|nr:hypothetical protein BCR44DRAFT_37294 [Catenaria anguillulae PL171]